MTSRDERIEAMARGIWLRRFPNWADQWPEFWAWYLAYADDPNCAVHTSTIAEALKDVTAAYDAGGIGDAVREFAQAALHGDDEHRAWLMEAAEAFVAGKPVPPARGSGNKE